MQTMLGQYNNLSFNDKVQQNKQIRDKIWTNLINYGHILQKFTYDKLDKLENNDKTLLCNKNKTQMTNIILDVFFNNTILSKT